MRLGINPEKIEPKKLTHKPHRVIIPVYIPNLEDEYFKNQLEVLKMCLDSLIATTQKQYTNITIINNNSCTEVSDLLEKYFLKGIIEKYIQFSENRGKVEPVLSEAMASFEEYITISDADVLFRPGWLKATMDIFDNFKDAGIVSPLPTPHQYLYCNSRCIVYNLIKGKLKLGSVASKKELVEFENSIGVDLLKEYYKNQFYLQSKNGLSTLLGSTHFIATYKNYFRVTDYRNRKVEFVFKNSQEKFFLDCINENRNLCRMSTVNSYVYHIGNKLDQNCYVEYDDNVSDIHFPKIKSIIVYFRFPSIVYKAFVKYLKYFKKNRKE